MKLEKDWLVIWIVKPYRVKTKEFDDPLEAREWMQKNVHGGRLYHHVE